MFNSYNHREGDTRIDVKKIPHDTADAARLYGEMVAKAEEQVARALIERLGASNEVTLVRIDSDRSHETDQLRVRVLFSLNGKLYDIRHDQNLTVSDQIRWIISNAIAEKVYNSLGGTNAK